MLSDEVAHISAVASPPRHASQNDFTSTWLPTHTQHSYDITNPIAHACACNTPCRGGTDARRSTQLAAASNRSLKSRPHILRSLFPISTPPTHPRPSIPGNMSDISSAAAVRTAGRCDDSSIASPAPSQSTGRPRHPPASTRPGNT